MKRSICFLLFLTAASSLLAGCGSPAPGIEPSAVPSQITGEVSAPGSTAEPAAVLVAGDTSCYAGPGQGYRVVSSLLAGQRFPAIGINYGLAEIDDEVTWLLVRPNAFGDPDPPPAADPSSADIYLQGLVYRCWVKGSEAGFNGDLAALPVIHRPILELVNEASCRSGPGAGYQPARMLVPGGYFEIIAVDDEITWVESAAGSDQDEVISIDDEVTWIDDEITWFLINPNTFIDPDPPPAADSYAAFSADGIPEGACWVNRDDVIYRGDLTRLAVVRLPEAPPALTGPTAAPGSKPDPKQPTQQGDLCSSYTTYIACMQHSNQGCDWEDKTGCYQK